MIAEHERIVLTENLPNERLEAGDVGTVVHIHRNGEAFVVEFFALDGSTAAVATVQATQLRAIRSTDISHARVLTPAQQSENLLYLPPGIISS